MSFLTGFPWRLPPGRPGDPGLFGPGSMAWRVNGEGVLLLAGPRALLMQIAHPLVAAGVADHSDFPAEPFRRLWRTLEAMLLVSFGDSGQSRRAAQAVTAVHREVTGERDGRPYRALDPDLLLWVHATLVDGGLVAYERFLGPLRPAEEEGYYQDMKRLAAAFEVPDSLVPSDLGAFRAYMERTVAELDVSEDARRLGPPIVSPPVPIALRPVAALQRLVTVGLLPGRLREAYGLSWAPTQERRLRGSSAAIRAVVPRLPGAIRRWPHARTALRRVRSGEVHENFTGFTREPPPGTMRAGGR